jgi:hypothetical protein
MFQRLNQSKPEHVKNTDDTSPQYIYILDTKKADHKVERFLQVKSHTRAPEAKSRHFSPQCPLCIPHTKSLADLDVKELFEG